MAQAGIPVFKICSCGKEWGSRDAFLADPAVQIVGYQVDFDEPLRGFFLLNHHACKTTMAVPLLVFRDLYDGPIFAQRKTGGEECPQYCLYPDNLERCPSKCACAFVREIIQVVRNWKKCTGD